MKPTLITIKDHHLVNPNQIVCIDLKGKVVFLSGTRYTEVSEEDMQKILKYFTILEDEEIENKE